MKALSPFLQDNKVIKVFFLILINLTICKAYASQTNNTISYIDSHKTEISNVAQHIWELAETSYQEYKSSQFLQDQLQKNGFSIKTPISNMKTGFIASYGSGKPVITILAEFDALPGISQDALPTRKILEHKKAGHACGHNLFAAGSYGAAIAVKDWLSQGHQGTLRVYGTPAEEGGGAKGYFVRDGYFNDVDVALHWHPSNANSASQNRSMAITSVKFNFTGVSAHAAAAPEKGRSALDGVESMNYMVNMMREHIPSNTRIHYVIPNGGKAPNVVPDKAQVHYFIRNPDAKVMFSIFERVKKAAQGAALGTGTSVSIDVDGGVYSLLPNHTLGKVMHNNLLKVGGINYTEQELVWANTIKKSLPSNKTKLADAATVLPFLKDSDVSMGSTDVGDVSWVVPTVGVRTATWVPGTPGHSWQSTAASGYSIGHKGTLVAAKTIALTAIDLFKSKKLIKAAKEEFDLARGADFTFKSMMLDSKPPKH